MEDKGGKNQTKKWELLPNIRLPELSSTYYQATICPEVPYVKTKRINKRFVLKKSPWGTRFSARLYRPWGPPILLQNWYRVFPGVKCGRGVLLTTHPLLVPWSWKSRVVPLPIYIYIYTHTRLCLCVCPPFFSQH